METHYTKIFSGNFLIVQRIVSELKTVGITPIIKDESESARLAGFGTFSQGIQDIHVHADNIDKAKAVIDIAISEMET